MGLKMIEFFKVIKDFPDYQISNYGRVYSTRFNRFLKPKRSNVIIKIENTEGFDCKPQRVLIDGVEVLAPVLSKLFELENSHVQFWHICS